MKAASLQQLESSLRGFKPRKKWYRHWCRRSAVAVILRETEQGLTTMMIKRAEREGDPWSGHMAFPGGRLDPEDANTLAAARRETLEEVGLPTEHYTRHLGRLSDLLARPRPLLPSRSYMVITPYLFSIEQVPELNINHEVDEVVWVPLSFLADRRNRQQMDWRVHNRRVRLPCYMYGRRRIWGLSLRMLDELVELIHRV